MKQYLYIFLISMLPLIELRGAVVYGMSMNLNYYLVMIISLIANSLVVPLIFLFARKILEYGANKKYTSRLFTYFLKKGHNVGDKLIKSSGNNLYIALMLFVGIPLPGSGAWTGTLAASLLDLDFKKTILANILGLFISFIIMTVFTFITINIIKG